MKKIVLTVIVICSFITTNLNAQINIGIITHSKSANTLDQPIDIEKVSNSGIAGSMQGEMILSLFSPLTGSIGSISNPNQQSRISLDFYNSANGFPIRKTICNSSKDAVILSNGCRYFPKQIKRINNGYAICGYYNNDSIVAGKLFGFLLQTDNIGNVMFFKRYEIAGNVNLKFNSLAPVNNGISGYVLVGSRSIVNNTINVADALIVDAQGNVLKNNSLKADSFLSSEFTKVIQKDSLNFMIVGSYGQSFYTTCDNAYNYKSSDILLSTINFSSKILRSRGYRKNPSTNIEIGVDLAKDATTNNTYIVSNCFVKTSCLGAVSNLGILVASINTSNLTNPNSWSVNWCKRNDILNSSTESASGILFKSNTGNLFVNGDLNGSNTFLFNISTLGVANSAVEVYSGSLLGSSPTTISSNSFEINNIGNVEILGVNKTQDLNLIERVGVSSGTNPCKQVLTIDSSNAYLIDTFAVFADTLPLSSFNDAHYSVSHNISIVNACNTLPSNFINYLSPLNISAQDTKSLKVIDIFPNPASASLFINVESNKNTNYDIIVYNLQGSVLIKNNIEMKDGINNLKIDIQNLASGIYFTVIKNNESSQVFRFEKE